jgi:hypothetical protein
MLRRLRSAHSVRTALCLAAVLSLGGSLGLHAEPGSRDGARPVTAAGAAAPAKALASHTCLICALYGSAFPSSGAFIAQDILPSLSGAHTSQPRRAASPVAPCHDGRAPPAVL